MFTTRFVSLCVFLLLTASCGDKRFKPVYPVKGSVFFEGKPAAGATLRFIPVNVPDHPWTRPQAQVDDAGEFTVTTYRENDGMPVGTYNVLLFWLPKGYNGPIEKANKLPARYIDPATSGVTVEIKAGENVLPPMNLKKS